MLSLVFILVGVGCAIAGLWLPAIFFLLLAGLVRPREPVIYGPPESGRAHSWQGQPQGLGRTNSV